MWKKWKESEFYRKLKRVRVNRALYLSAVVILLSLAVVLAITAATNRAKKNPDPDTTVTDPVQTDPIDEPATLPPPATEDNKPTLNPDVVPELSLPVAGKLTQKHSTDTQVFSPTLQEWRMHLGIDISTAESAPVLAVADGKVQKIWEDPMMGWCVALSHSGECVTVYKNLAKDLAENLAVDKTVKKGELLGYVGNSAMIEIAQEPHLHMEMTVKGLQVDPLEYFSAAVIKTLSEDTIYEEEIGK